MKKIKLGTKEEYAIVDDSDFELVSKSRWYLQAVGKHKSARADFKENGIRRKISMSRFLMNCPKGMVVDHINGDSLDNRRKNLRICTPKENCRNIHLTKRGKMKNIYQIPSGKFRVLFQVDGKRHHFGMFETVEEAMKVHKKVRKQFFGEFG